MQSNFKPGQTVTIKKVGMFFGLSGKIVTHNSETTFKPLKVDLDGLGEWSFDYIDIVSPQKETLLKEPKTVKSTNIITDGVNGLGYYPKEVKVKRPYVKKDKSKPKKEKRAYNKKPKT